MQLLRRTGATSFFFHGLRDFLVVGHMLSSEPSRVGRRKELYAWFLVQFANQAKEHTDCDTSAIFVLDVKRSLLELLAGIDEKEFRILLRAMRARWSSRKLGHGASPVRTDTYGCAADA